MGAGVDRRSGRACQPGRLSAWALALLLAGCAAGAPDTTTHRFDQLAIGRRTAVPAPSAVASSSPTPRPGPLAARPPASASPPLARAVSVATAERRLDALLSASGFRQETSRVGDLVSILAERMATAAPPEAICGVRALDRPAMYAATLDVRLAPAPRGVEVGVRAAFVELDRNLVSGGFSKRPCRSRGVLEAVVRRTALGG